MPAVGEAHVAPVVHLDRRLRRRFIERDNSNVMSVVNLVRGVHANARHVNDIRSVNTREVHVANSADLGHCQGIWRRLHRDQARSRGHNVPRADERSHACRTAEGVGENYRKVVHVVGHLHGSICLAAHRTCGRSDIGVGEHGKQPPRGYGFGSNLSLSAGHARLVR